MFAQIKMYWCVVQSWNFLSRVAMIVEIISRTNFEQWKCYKTFWSPCKHQLLICKKLFVQNNHQVSAKKKLLADQQLMFARTSKSFVSLPLLKICSKNNLYDHCNSWKKISWLYDAPIDFYLRKHTLLLFFDFHYHSDHQRADNSSKMKIFRESFCEKVAVACV